MPFEVDILEDTLAHLSPELLDILLTDQTKSRNGQNHHIFWATSDYEKEGLGFNYFSPITADSVTGKNGHIIMPRILKGKETQIARSREMAEVFTPSWVCNAQNNLIDGSWFGRKDVFNLEIITNDGKISWEPITSKVEFPEHKSWKDYIEDIRLEITCGEAPYLVSRYDTTTGEPIPLKRRIGILDRKIRIINENAITDKEWEDAILSAYKSTYGYEWQGDNLLLAREALLVSYVEYYEARFNTKPSIEKLKAIATIISWNIWQMDGLKGVVPNSCQEKVSKEILLFGEIQESKTACVGCQTGKIKKHNGIYCYIMDWTKKGQNKTLGKQIRFVDLLR